MTDSAISATSGLLAANDHASLVHPVANTAPRPGHVRLITGAPGSGKTTLAMQTAVHRIENGQQPDDVLVMTASRAASARLRHALSDHLQRTSSSPLVRSVASTAFAIVRAHAVANQEPPPVLVSGPEQDAVLVELIEGHLAGEGVQPQWPDTIPEESLPLKGFRAELRDLLMRAAEHGLSPSQLKELGKTYAMPAWVAGADVYGEYLDVTAQRWATPDAGERFDAAGIVDSAAHLLGQWEEAFTHDPRGALPEPPRWKTVIVDDYQEATAATVRLLHEMRAAGAELILIGDPDTAVQTFRGARPDFMGRAAATADGTPGAFDAEEIVLPVIWGQSPTIRRVVKAMTPLIGSVGAVKHREAGCAKDNQHGDEGSGKTHAEVEGSDDPSEGVRIAVANSAHDETRSIAYELRRAHVVDQLAWRDIAVIVRSGAQADGMRRALSEHAVPTVDESAEVLLRSEPAVQPLLTALDYATGTELNADEITALLTSPLGGLDSIDIKRLRRHLWRQSQTDKSDDSQEEQSAAPRNVDDYLVELIDHPQALTLPSGIRYPVERITAMLHGAREANQEKLATVETVLWAAWDATKLASAWQKMALAGGAAGAQADHDLDAVMALFTAASRFEERMPGVSVDSFTAQIRSETLPADTLAARAVGQDAVAVHTAASAAGLRWEFVVVAGVQENVWPDVRLRDTVLGAQRLADVLTGRDSVRAQDGTGKVERDLAAARRDVLHDEARTFLVALSRARSRLLVTAVSDVDQDQEPSGFIDALTANGVETGQPVGLDDPDRVPVTLRELVAFLRRESLSDEPSLVRDHAENILAVLADAHVPGADPRTWNGIAELSTRKALREPEENVHVSPSQVDSFITCPLRWALEQAGGRGADSVQQHFGTLIHEVAARVPEGTQEQMKEILDELWPSLQLPHGWIEITKRAEAEESVRRLAQYIAEGREVVCVEQEFALEVGRARVYGIADRVERTSTGALRVVDFKTGAHAAKDDIPRHTQLGAYQLAAERGAFIPGPAKKHPEDAESPPLSAGAALVYLGKQTVKYKQLEQAALSEDEDPQWVEKRIMEVADDMSGATFEARKNPGCGQCPVRSSCPLQREGARVTP